MQMLICRLPDKSAGNNTLALFMMKTYHCAYRNILRVAAESKEVFLCFFHPFCRFPADS